MDTTQESAPVQPNNDISIDIDIHRETGLIVVEKIGIPDQGIELTVEDVEALSAFVQQHGDRLAHSSDFQESVSEAIHQPGFKEKLKAATEKVNKLGGAVAIKELPHHADVQEFKRLVKIKKADLAKWEKKPFDESANEPYEDSIKRALRAAEKAKNAEAVVYYDDCLYNHSACASFERFKGSAAYDSWKTKVDVAEKIAAKNADYKRFSWRSESSVNEVDGTTNVDQYLRQELRRIGTTLNGQEKVDQLMRKYQINKEKATHAVKSSAGYEHDLGDGKTCETCKGTGELVGKGIYVKGTVTKCPKCGGSGKSINENDTFDVESEEHWNDSQKVGMMTKKDVAMGHGKVHFTSNTGTKYTVEMSGGKLRSVVDGRGNVYDLAEIQQYWDKGFPLIGAIAATIGDPNSGGAEEEERGMLYPPEELQETDKEPAKEKLPRTRCERCGKPVNPGISSRKCPSCHESDLSDAESYYGVQEGGLHVDKGQQLNPSALSEEAPPGFPKSIYEKLVIKFKGDKKKINEVMWALHRKSKNEGESLDEKSPPNFPKSLHDKLLLQYKAEPEKAYAIMWKLHNEHGDKLESVVNEVSKKVVKKSDKKKSKGKPADHKSDPNDWSGSKWCDDQNN